MNDVKVFRAPASFPSLEHFSVSMGTHFKRFMNDVSNRCLIAAFLENVQEISARTASAILHRDLQPI